MADSLKHRSILLVEDNDDDEILTRRALEKSLISNPVVVARDSGEALEYLFATDLNRPLPGVVLLDLSPSRVDGLEVLRRLRSEERTRFLPVVVLATLDEDRDIVASYALGANSYVRKPLRFVQFSRAVAQLASYWLQVNEAPPDPLDP